jgi:arylsulfatase A-like enzyme
MRAAALLALAALGSIETAEQQRDDRPNVIVIMTDDMGYGDLGVYGAPDVRTPHLDALARDGVRLTEFYANGATCTPTRAAFISGRYQQRVLLEAPLSTFKPDHAGLGLPAEGRSLPQLLKNSGYRTALIGKWHLGWTPEFSPRAHGFDEFFGFKSGYIDHYRHTNGSGDADLFDNDRPIEADGYMTDLITERSVRFIEQHAGGPFFLDVAYSAPHWPYQRPDSPSVADENARHVGPLDDPTNTRADYVAMVERLDQGVGRLLETLDRVGLRDRTLVIFTSDNGGEWLSRNAPFFHHKGTVWEGGIRVPAILRWPGRLPAGAVSGQAGITMDLTASILKVTGAVVPADARLDGMDLLPILEGRAPEVERTLFWRVTDGRTQTAVRSGDWKLLIDNGRELLFNLREDPGEREDRIGERSDVARRLMPLLTAWEKEVAAVSD